MAKRNWLVNIKASENKLLGTGRPVAACLQTQGPIGQAVLLRWPRAEGAVGASYL